MTPVFSINAASELLERNRRTVTKALRHVPPDKKEHGQPRWKLPTILSALDQLPGSSTAARRRSNNNHGDGWVDPRVTKLTDEFTAAIDALDALPLKQRREIAKKELGPRLEQVGKLLRQYGLENNPGQDELVGYRAESIWRTYLMWIRHLCEWTVEDAFKFLQSDDEDD